MVDKYKISYAYKKNNSYADTLCSIQEVNRKKSDENTKKLIKERNALKKQLKD